MTRYFRLGPRAEDGWSEHPHVPQMGAPWEQRPRIPQGLAHRMPTHHRSQHTFPDSITLSNALLAKNLTVCMTIIQQTNYKCF